jgi:hypothetical protein
MLRERNEQFILRRLGAPRALRIDGTTRLGGVGEKLHDEWGCAQHASRSSRASNPMRPASLHRVGPGQIRDVI